MSLVYLFSLKERQIIIRVFLLSFFSAARILEENGIKKPLYFIKNTQVMFFIGIGDMIFHQGTYYLGSTNSEDKSFAE